IDHYLKHELSLLAESDRRNRVRHLDWWRERLGERLLTEIGPSDVREFLRSPSARSLPSTATVLRSRPYSRQSSRRSGSPPTLSIAPAGGNALTPSARKSATGR